MILTNKPSITVITPTTGKPSLSRLIDSLEIQTESYWHLLIWDDVRDPRARDPESYRNDTTHSLQLPGRAVQGAAAGSALRAVGLMAANTPYVTFADDDVWFDKTHFTELLTAIDGHNWAYTMRRIFSPAGNFIGVDRFESIGDDSDLPYDLVDNSSNMFTRQFGVAAAHLYRETQDYNDDRLMYAFLKKHAGTPGKTQQVTANQICPGKLETFFRQHCSLK